MDKLYWMTDEPSALPKVPNTWGLKSEDTLTPSLRKLLFVSERQTKPWDDSQRSGNVVLFLSLERFLSTHPSSGHFSHTDWNPGFLSHRNCRDSRLLKPDICVGSGSLPLILSTSLMSHLGLDYTFHRSKHGCANSDWGFGVSLRYFHSLL